jgi:hypothetical protein
MRAYVQQSTLDSVQVMRIRLMQLCTTMHILTHPHTKFLHHMDQQGSWSAHIPFTPLTTRVTCQMKVTYSASHPCPPSSFDTLLPASALHTGTELTILQRTIQLILKTRFSISPRGSGTLVLPPQNIKFTTSSHCTYVSPYFYVPTYVRRMHVCIFSALKYAQIRRYVRIQLIGST